MQTVHAQLQETIQTLYRKAVDADNKLDQLQQAQQGKFAAIFSQDSGFRSHSKRFTPYVQEITEDWQQLKDMDEESARQALPALVAKLQLALETVTKFQQSLK
ncbi:primosomal replication protein PriC [Salinimonas chungwhensis]|uniref:primosomal replication protein PriC n=1 Tax=Salinimonas chungwhensis TaxID=265425 RepID=UPI00037654AF|nr:primosomal replication protein PriC [Salinimonas chungwhensis]